MTTGGVELGVKTICCLALQGSKLQSGSETLIDKDSDCLEVGTGKLCTRRVTLQLGSEISSEDLSRLDLGAGHVCSSRVPRSKVKGGSGESISITSVARRKIAGSVSESTLTNKVCDSRGAHVSTNDEDELVEDDT